MAELQNEAISFDSLVDNASRDYMSKDEDKNASIQIMEEKITYGTLDLSSDDLRQRAWRAVNDRYWAVKPQHDVLQTKLDQWEQMWKIGVVDKDKDTLAYIGSVDVWNAVEDWTMTIVDAVFGVDPPLEVKGKKKRLNNELKEKVTKILWTNAKATNIEEESEIGIREGIKSGTFCFKTPYQLDEEVSLVVKSKPKNFNIAGINIPTPFQEKFVEQKIETEDRAALKALDLRKLFFRYDKPSWFIEEINSSWEQVDKQAKELNLYGNIERAKGIAYPVNQESDRETKDKNKIPSNPNTALNVQKLDGDVMLWEAHHIPFTFKDEDPVPDDLKGKKVLCIITVANQLEVVRIQPTPFRVPPYIICPMFKQPGTVLGIGIPEIIEYLIREFNTRKNQSLDANTFGLYCMVAANMRYIKKREQLKIRQNGVIELKDMPAGTSVNDVVSFTRPPVEYVQIAQTLMNDLKQEITKTTRLKGNIGGERMTPKVTATEATNIAQEAFKSVKLILKRVDRNIFEEYFKRAYIMMVLNRQKSWIVEMERQVPAIDPQTGMPQLDQMGQPVMKKESIWEETTPEQIYSDGIDIEMQGTSHMEGETVQQHKIMQAMDLATKFVPGPIRDDQGRLVIFNVFKGMNDILYTLNIEDVKDYWMPVPEPMIPAGAPGPQTPQPPNIPKAPGAPSVRSKNPTAPSIIKGAVGGAT